MSSQEHIKEQIAESAKAEFGQKLLGSVILDKYRVERLLGVGGWAKVYLAEQIGLGRKVAVKVLHANMIDDAEKLSRFQREAALLASMKHPNLLAVHDYGVLDSKQPYVVMDCIQGKTVEQLLREQKQLPIGTVLRVAIDVSEALSAAHAKGVIHRDIKPANIAIDDAGRQAWLLDFGIAKIVNTESAEKMLTATGETLGTPAYMSPEQCKGIHLDDRSDIYSLGCVLYELICGAPPFTAPTIFDCLTMQISTPPQPLRKHRPDVPKAVEQLVLNCLAKEPSGRYPSAAALRADLKQIDASANVRISATDKISQRRSLKKAGIWALVVSSVMACSMALLPCVMFAPLVARWHQAVIPYAYATLLASWGQFGLAAPLMDRAIGMLTVPPYDDAYFGLWWQGVLVNDKAHNWDRSEALCKDVLQHSGPPVGPASPNRIMAHAELGVVYAGKGELTLSDQQFAEAEALARETVRINNLLILVVSKHVEVLRKTHRTEQIPALQQRYPFLLANPINGELTAL